MRVFFGFVLLAIPLGGVGYGLYLIHPGLAYVTAGISVLAFYVACVMAAKHREKQKDLAELRKMYGE